MFKYSYDEAKEYWEYCETRRGLLITREDYLNRIIKRFNLVSTKHKKYLSKYYDRYIEEKGACFK